MKKLRERLESHSAIVDLEHALFDMERQRQKLGQPVAHPGRVIEREIGGKVLTTDAADQELQQFGEREVRLWKRDRWLRRNRRDLPDHQAILCGRVRLDL